MQTFKIFCCGNNTFIEREIPALGYLVMDSLDVIEYIHCV